MNLRHILLIIIIIAVKLAAGVTVWFPDTTAAPQTEIRLPLYLESVQISDSIVAYDCSIEYDSQILTLEQVHEQESMTVNWGQPFANLETGRCTVAGFTSNLPDHRLIDSTKVWLYFDFWVEGEPDSSAGVRITRFQLYPLEGEIITESASPGQIHIALNYPPVISIFPGANILEDDSLMVQVDQYISDPDNTWRELRVEFQSVPNAVTMLDSSGRLMIRPSLNWSGQLILPFQVSDPLGASANGELNLQVIPIPDPPMPFQLISPNDTTLSREDTIIPFLWNPSENMDPGDRISYRFLLGQDSLFQDLETIVISELEENHVSLNRLLPAGRYFWKVMAQDQQGLSRWCEQPCSFDLQEGSQVRDMNADSFGLQQNYPNPFNMKTNIVFRLEREHHVSLKIIDSSGRLIRIIINQYLGAGEHRIIWDGTDQAGIPVNSGVYHLVLSARDRLITRKLIMLK